MEWLLIVGGSLAAVLLFVWGSRKLYNSVSHRFWFEGEMHTRHGDGHFTNEAGVRIAEPDRVARLQAEWAVVSDAHASRQRDLQRQLDGEPDPEGTRRPERSRLEKILDLLGSF
jgi:hypothetical protein